VGSAALTADQTNIVTADGKFDDPASSSATQTATVTVKVHDCTISVTKETTTPGICSGKTASYQIVVKNNSDKFSWTGSVVDDKLGTLDATLTLGPGASKDYIVGSAALTADQTNIVTADGKFDDPASSSATQTATVTVKVHDCTISVTKETSTPDICSGKTASYKIVVTNNSDKFSWTGSVIDDKLGTLDATLTLGPGASKTYTPVSAPLTADQTNIVTADGKFDDPASSSAKATAQATVKVHVCTISITKTPDKTEVCKGANEQVTYTYIVTNNSDKFSVSGSVTDDKFGSIGSFGPLAPGASATLTKVATVNDTVTNKATATGTFDDPASSSASATAEATVTGKDCAKARIAPTETNCAAYRDNPDSPANNLEQLFYTKSGTLISNVTPGVFFYYMQVTVAAAGPQSFTLVHSSLQMPGVFFDIASGSAVFNSSCAKVADVNVQNSTTGDVTISFNAPAAGTYIIGVKFNSKSIQGETAPSPSATFTFKLTSGGVDVANSIDTLNLVPKP
jgi:hypothetical protein